MKKILTTIAFIGISISTVFTQELVKDINPGTSNSEPINFTKIGDKAYFVAESTGNGVELWTTDGTEAGTMLLKDIDAGNGQGVSSDVEILELNGNAIFSADNGNTGNELWISDGTAAGTSLLKEIHGSPTAGNGSFPKYLTKMGDEIFFNASDKIAGVYNEELWKTDGTTAGTVLVKEINTSTRSRPAYLTEMNGKIYFSADDGTGPSLWATDGSAAGTVLVKGYGIATIPFSPKNIFKMGDEIFFTAYGNSTNNELWKSDGTAAGTVLVKDIAAGAAASSQPYNFTISGDFLFFKINGGDIWRTDGTEAGTEAVAVSSDFTTIYEMVNFDDALYFAARENTYGTELYKATISGTQLVKDINLGTGPGLSNNSHFEVHGSKLFLKATDGSWYKLWQTDGTEAGTIEVANQPSDILQPEEMFSFGNRLLYAASDNSAGGIGTELWVFDNLSSLEISEVACPSFTYEGNEYTETGDYEFTFTNTLGYDSTVILKLTIDCDTAITIGISTLEDLGLSAFPNPLTDVLNINTEEKLSSISLLNFHGAIIKTFDPSLKSFDVSGVSTGIYFLEVKSVEKKSMIKILKK
jgi:ELWxxDGT repeat protein